jgi:hypothetical protein
VAPSRNESAQPRARRRNPLDALEC